MRVWVRVRVRVNARVSARAGARVRAQLLGLRLQPAHVPLLHDQLAHLVRARVRVRVRAS